MNRSSLKGALNTFLLMMLFIYTGLSHGATADNAKQKSIDQLKSVLSQMESDASFTDAEAADAIEANEKIAPQDAAAVADELDADARSYAADFSISVSEARQRLRMQPKLGKVLALLEEVNRERFAGAWIEHSPTFQIVMRLTGNEPVEPWQASLVVSNAVPLVVKTGSRITLAEQLATINASLPALKKQLPELAGTDVDVKTGEVVLMMEKGAAAVDSQQSLLSRLSGLASPKINKLLDLPLRVEQIDAPVGDGHTRGGANLSTCTSGFVARNASGVTGYLTAGHCGNTQTYYEFDGVSYASTFISEIRDANQDVQLHSTSHVEYPHFYASSTSVYRELTSRTTRANQSVGGYVCHRGKTTGYSCGDIASTSYRPTYANACNGLTCDAVWIRVAGDSLKCYPGDSGGPWFLVNSAYGIYKGQSSSGTNVGDCTWAIYMASNYFGFSLIYAD